MLSAPPSPQCHPDIQTPLLAPVALPAYLLLPPGQTPAPLLAPEAGFWEHPRAKKQATNKSGALTWHQSPPFLSQEVGDCQTDILHPSATNLFWGPSPKKLGCDLPSQ